MEFVNPLFLFGLFAIAIPVIVHLFNFRKFQKVYFTNVKFIEELKQQTQKQSQLKHLLVLLSRILAVIFLVLAFAQPYIPVSKNDTKKEVRNAISIYIDNSFSMEAQSTEGMLLDEARQKAREIASAYKNSDQFQLLTNDFEGKHQRFVSRDEFIEMVDEVGVSSVTQKISDVFKRQSDLLKGNMPSNNVAYLISDFQEEISDFSNISPDTSIMAYLVPVEASKIDNLYIDSVWFESPVHRINQLVYLNCRIVNASENDFEKIPVKLLINDQQRAIASFDVKSGEDVVVTMPYTNNEDGIQNGRLEITDYPITYDDVFYFAYEVKSEIPVLSIYQLKESPYLKSLFGEDSAFIYQSESGSRLNYASFNRFDLIILDNLNNISSGLTQELLRFAENGGTIALFPGIDQDITTYHEFALALKLPTYNGLDTFQTRVEQINFQSKVFDDVFESIPENIDLPVVFRHYPIYRQTRLMVDVLLEMLDGDIFLCTIPVGRGKLYLFATPLDAEWTNFPKHAIFVPTMYKMALLSNPVPGLYYTIGEDEKITVDRIFESGDQIFKIRDIGGSFEIIPEIQPDNAQLSIFTRNQILNDGHFELIFDGQVISGVAFNYNRLESDLSHRSKSDLENDVMEFELQNFAVIAPTEKSLSGVIRDINQGIQLWKLFVILALLFLLAEVLLIRFAKH
nr:BatA domain-containing protein [Bacteroidota bacterium]